MTMGRSRQRTRWRIARVVVGTVAAAVAVAAMETRGVGQTSGRAGAPADPPADVRFMTLDPGHFHAALVQKEMYPGVSPVVSVYAPLGPDLLGHLARVSAYNLRAAAPTAWRLDVHTGPDYLARMLREKPGNVVVLSGRNAGKIERVDASVEAGLNVLVDKPWILKSADLPKLTRALDEAEKRKLVAYDIMTERFEASNALQRALVMDPAVFGAIVPGTPAEPGVYIESVHHLMKVVSGAPNIRPTWFFDVTQQGEGFNDIGTHLVDLVQWTLSPDRVVDAKADVKVLDAYRWPTLIPESDFKRVTGTGGFPEALKASVKDGSLEYFCNTFVTYTLRNVNVSLNVIWDWEAPAGGGDTHFAVYRGTKARIEARQTKADGYKPEVYIVPNNAADAPAILAAAQARLAAVAGEYPGVGVMMRGTDIKVVMPEALRVGHEAHFAQVTAKFLTYLRDRSTLPAWERPNMVAKYTVTTLGTEMSRDKPVKVAPRLAPK
jgi:predicted dehydrogenase